jgi:hypothetical protein
MNFAERLAGYVDGETVVAAGLFERRGAAAAIGDERGLPTHADPEREAPGFPSNTILDWQRAGSPRMAAADSEVLCASALTD